jgi:citrate lyase subunit beta/citryl-CoA lyase
MWRSFLFVPVLSERFLAKAGTRGADAVVLDLEDSIPAGQKDAARAALPDAIAGLAAQDADVLVRVNAGKDLVAADIAAAVGPNLRAVVLPKVEGAADAHNAGALIAEAEAAAGMAVGATGLIAQVESAVGFLAAAEIAAEPRVTAMTLGVEDFAVSTGARPIPSAVGYPAQHVIICAKAHGKSAFVMPGHMREFENVALFEEAARIGRDLGSDGGFAIHPRQIEVLNRVFTPSDDEVAAARRIVEAFDAVGGQGAISVDGQMIDPPVAEQARRVLARAKAD